MYFFLFLFWEKKILIVVLVCVTGGRGPGGSKECYQ